MFLDPYVTLLQLHDKLVIFAALMMPLWLIGGLNATPIVYEHISSNPLSLPYPSPYSCLQSDPRTIGSLTTGPGTMSYFRYPVTVPVLLFHVSLLALIFVQCYLAGRFLFLRTRTMTTAIAFGGRRVCKV